MSKEAVYSILLLVTDVSTLVLNIQLARAGETIYIRADGSIDPSNVSIERSGDTYTFIDNIFNMSIVVQKDNITLNGNGHMLQCFEFIDNGIDLYSRKNVTVNNILILGFSCGIFIHLSHHNKIINNTVVGAKNFGIWLDQSSYNYLAYNTILGTDEAVSLERSNSNTLYGNKVMNSFQGISLSMGTNNTLRNNVMAANKYNFFVGIYFREYYFHDIDTSNMIDGKPIYYWINRFNVTVPIDAGCVVIVNSSKIIVKNLILQNSACIFAYTTDSLIENITVTNGYGIDLEKSDFNLITKNKVTANLGAGIALMVSNYNIVSYNTVVNTAGCGIWLEDTNSNSVIGNDVSYSYASGFQEFVGAGILVDDSPFSKVIANNLTKNKYGIAVGACLSSNNLIIRNNLIMNYVGLILFESKNNIVYHNNFLENELQNVCTYYETRNILDNGYPSYGNYWSDYAGIDLHRGPYQNLTGSDGIGDTPYVIDSYNIDHYPLMHPWRLEDVNCDGYINVLDLIVVANALGTSPSDSDGIQMRTLRRTTR